MGKYLFDSRQDKEKREDLRLIKKGGGVDIIELLIEEYEKTHKFTSIRTL